MEGMFLNHYLHACILCFNFNIMSVFTDDSTMDIEIIDFEGHKEVTITVVPEFKSAFECLIDFIENGCECYNLYCRYQHSADCTCENFSYFLLVNEDSTDSGSSSLISSTNSSLNSFPK